VKWLEYAWDTHYGSHNGLEWVHTLAPMGIIDLDFPGTLLAFLRRGTQPQALAQLYSSTVSA
jgi:hypothetical protein